MATRTMYCNTTEHRQNFLTLFKSLTTSRNYWQAWQDFCYLIATELSQPIDFRQEREDEYKRIMKGYSAKEVETIVKMLNELVDELEDGFKKDGFGCVLGDLYEQLELSNRWKGQFFTPYNVSLMTAKMNGADGIKDEIEKKGYITVNDPTCGAGGMLIAFAEHCHTEGINYQQDVWFVGQDVDPVVAYMCYIQMSLLAMPGVVIIGNTLTDDYDNYDRWYTMMAASDLWQYRRRVERVRDMMKMVTDVSAEPEAPQETSTGVITLGQIEQMDLFAEAV